VAAALSLIAGAVPVSAAGGYTVTATIAVGTDPNGVAVDPVTGTVYVSDESGVSVIDAATSTVTATIPGVSWADAAAADPAAGTVYVANTDYHYETGYGEGTVSVIDAATGAVTATVPVGVLPDGMAVDPATHAVYVANNVSGTVSVISTLPAQAIAFTSAPPAKPVTGGTYRVSATGGGSGNPVTFTIDAASTSVCSISGKVVTFNAGGSCVIDVNQAGNAGYAAAPQAQQTVTVAAAAARLSWAAPAPVTYGTALTGTQLDAAASVPGAFSYSPPAGTVLKAGTQTLTATFTLADPAGYTGGARSAPRSRSARPP
jgi:YVTN family beta-propeller protein